MKPLARLHAHADQRYGATGAARYPERRMPPTKYLNRYLKTLVGNFYVHEITRLI